jgi:hypothetical protein
MNMDSSKTTQSTQSTKSTYGNNTYRNACGFALAIIANAVIALSVVGLFDGEVSKQTQQTQHAAASQTAIAASQGV